MSNFKIGDRVRVTEDLSRDFFTGATGVIYEIGSYGRYPIKVTLDEPHKKQTNDGWREFCAKELELIDEFKVGATVEVTRRSCQSYQRTGKIVKINDIGNIVVFVKGYKDVLTYNRSSLKVILPAPKLEPGAGSLMNLSMGNAKTTVTPCPDITTLIINPVEESFKVGDKIRIISIPEGWSESYKKYIGKEGIITTDDKTDRPYQVTIAGIEAATINRPYLHKQNIEHIKPEMMKQDKLIGYKLKDSAEKYRKVALKLLSSDGEISFASRSKFPYDFAAGDTSDKVFKEAGVLDIWFDEVREEVPSFKVGDIVLCGGDKTSVLDHYFVHKIHEDGKSFDLRSVFNDHVYSYQTITKSFDLVDIKDFKKLVEVKFGQYEAKPYGSDGVEFGCQKFTMADLQAYLKLFNTEVSGRLSIKGITVTEDTIEKLIVISKLK